MYHENSMGFVALLWSMKKGKQTHIREPEKNLTHYPGLENDITFTLENFVYLKEIRNGNRSTYLNEDFTDMLGVLKRTNENSQPTGIETLNKSFEENNNYHKLI